MRLLFKGGFYSSEAYNSGNTVYAILFIFTLSYKSGFLFKKDPNQSSNLHRKRTPEVRAGGLGSGIKQLI